jgi:Na+/H+ antiporter NhaD/arsenite permease-like protein
MNLATGLIILGLLLNTIASIVLLLSYLNIEKNVQDEYITDMDKKTGKYIQIKDLKNFKISVLGFVLFIFGFIFQIIGILAQIYR